MVGAYCTHERTRRSGPYPWMGGDKVSGEQQAVSGVSIGDGIMASDIATADAKTDVHRPDGPAATTGQNERFDLLAPHAMCFRSSLMHSMDVIRHSRTSGIEHNNGARSQPW